MVAPGRDNVGSSQPHQLLESQSKDVRRFCKLLRLQAVEEEGEGRRERMWGLLQLKARG